MAFFVFYFLSCWNHQKSQQQWKELCIIPEIRYEIQRVFPVQTEIILIVEFTGRQNEREGRIDNYL